MKIRSIVIYFALVVCVFIQNRISAYSQSFKLPWNSGVSYYVSRAGTPAPSGSIASSCWQNYGYSPHTYIAIDFDSPNGVLDPVRAAAAGTVIYAQMNMGGYGNLVKIKHSNNTVTYYAHLSAIYVSVNDVVQQGCAIGDGGTTGNSTGDHIHFEWRDVGEAPFTNTYPSFTECGCEPHPNYCYTSANSNGSCSGAVSPPNDYCNNAVSLPVNSSCSYLTNQNLAGATQSASPSNCTGGGTGTVANDVWYSFVATASCQNINVDGGSGFDAVVRLYSGCGTNGPTGFMTCVDQTGNSGVETIVATGLTIGQTYYISVYEYYGAGQGLTFSICVYSPGAPSQPGSITGNQSPCVGASQTYSVGSVSGATSYIWTYPSGWVTNGSTTNSISFTAVGGNIGSITVRAVNGCGMSSLRSLSVTPSSNTTQPGPISGNLTPCQGSSQTYSITSLPGATSYTWSFPGGWTTGGSTNPSISFSSVGSISGNISVVAHFACGTSASSTIYVSPIPIPSQPGSITGNQSPCVGSSQTYSVGSVSGATSYAWTFPNGWSTNGSTSNTFTVYAVGANGGNISVTATNACGTSLPSILSVAPSSNPVPPGSISGNLTPCSGSSQTYSVASLPGAVSYTWSHPFGWSTGGSTSNSISFSSVGGISGNVSVTANYPCGSSTASTIYVTPISLPLQPGQITGNQSPCVGSSQNYVVSAVSGATSYTWAYPSGWATNGSTSNTILFNMVGANPGFISVTAQNICGSSPAQNLSISPVSVPSQPGIINASNNNPCPGTQVTYSTNIVSGATGYNWSVPVGWTISGGQGSNSIVVTVGFASGTITVYANNTCGQSLSQNLTVTIGSVPQQPGAITSSIVNPCNGSQVTFSIIPVSGASGYLWTVPSGWIVNGGQGTNNLLVTVLGSGGNVSVAAQNVCGTGSSQVLAVILGSAPAQPGSISSSNSTPCHGSQVTYSIAQVPGANSYIWTVPLGWIVNGGQGTNSLLATIMNIGGDVSVSAENNCGTSMQQTLSVTMGSAPLQPGPITASDPDPCMGTQMSLSINPVLGATSYNWVVPSGWIINSGSGTTSILVTILGAGGIATVSASNNCGTSNLQTISVSPSNIPPTPGAIVASSPNPCVGDQVTYSIGTVSSATAYTWTVPNGWTVNSGQGTTNLVVTVGNASGDVAVAAGNHCGLSAIQSLTVNVTTIPTAPASIVTTNPNPVSGMQVTYSASSVSGATSYSWTVPMGWAINSGQGSPILNTTIGGGGGDVCVTAENICGSSVPMCLSVNVLTNVEAIPPDLTLTVFPNPTTGSITVTIENEDLDNVTIELFDMCGRRLRNLTVERMGSPFHFDLDLASYAKATYLLRIACNGWVQFRKVVRT